MTGRLVLPPERYKPRHWCEPPRSTSATMVVYEDMVTRIPSTIGEGALWRCDCGQYWESTVGNWEKTRTRRALKLIRQRRKQTGVDLTEQWKQARNEDTR